MEDPDIPVGIYRSTAFVAGNKFAAKPPTCYQVPRSIPFVFFFDSSYWIFHCRPVVQNMWRKLMQNRSLARDDSGCYQLYTGHRCRWCSVVQFASTVTYVVYLHFDCCVLILWPTKWVCGVAQNMATMILVVCVCVVWSMNHCFSQNYLLYFVTCSFSSCISMFNHHVEWTCQTHAHNLYVYHCCLIMLKLIYRLYVHDLSNI